MSFGRYDFKIVDVFAEARFGGNQLAVLPDARGLSESDMQALAREFNFAETTFVLPPIDVSHTARVRIFTPKAELPFAGHPTVGTAAVLAASGLGRAVEGGTTELVLEEEIGPIRASARVSPLGYEARFSLGGTVEMPAVRPALTNVAGALSSSPDEILETWFASIGPRFCFVRLRSAKSVDAAVLDRAAWATNVATSWASNIHLFAGDPFKSGELHARMFAPALGIEEDPATGSAAAILVGSAAASPNVMDGELRLRIRQGVVLGRPSLIEAAAVKREGRVEAIHVAGQVVFVAEGTIAVS